jgi:hypothetical protein
VATVALRRPRVAWPRSIAGVRAIEAGGLVALVGLSLAMRTTRLGIHFWIDEGISVGIAHHALTDIPGVLRMDGSPPLYYLLLHVWIGWFGDSETATHWLSVLFALLCIPAALWAGRSVFDRLTGWTFAWLVALCPFLTSYAQETRMYSMVALLGILTTACFLHAYVRGRRAYRIPFGVLLAVMLYTHNWALYIGAALAVALAIVWHAAPAAGRPAVLRDGALGFGTAALLYLPWVPTLLFQARHTGAPWSDVPSFAALLRTPDHLLGGQAGTYTVVLVAGVGLLAIARPSDSDRRVLVPVILVVALLPIMLAWLSSQVSPAWASRYLAAALGPMLLVAAVGIRRAGRLGLAAIALLTVAWAFAGAPSEKSNAHDVAEEMTPLLQRGDLVLSTQPDQLPVLYYYFPHDMGLRWATPFGITHDPGVTDWRDGVEHFERTGVDTQLLPELARLPVGRDVLLVVPEISRAESWQAPWTNAVWARTWEYEGVLRGDPRFDLTAIFPQEAFGTPGPDPLQGLLFRKVRSG